MAKVDKYSLAQEELSKERTLMSNERTMLSYVRTGLTAFVLGFGLIKLFAETRGALLWGYVAILVGILFIVVGIVHYTIRGRKIMDFDED
ncbi:DUF202 domain-containing protein [Candidatus Pacearchaeota archaeon]|nr:DUF202 domain-containing protein [Candidatus Pacearchaeota archaeon]